LGSRNGMANVGECYEHGTGVKRNKQEAIKWYQKAAKQGDKFSENKLQKLIK